MSSPLSQLQIQQKEEEKTLENRELSDSRGEKIVRLDWGEGKGSKIEYSKVKLVKKIGVGTLHWARQSNEKKLMACLDGGGKEGKWRGVE